MCVHSLCWCDAQQRTSTLNTFLNNSHVAIIDLHIAGDVTRVGGAESKRPQRRQVEERSSGDTA